MKSFFIGCNQRDDVMIDIYTKTQHFSGKITEDVWATVNVDFLFECRPDGDDLLVESPEIECIMLTREEYEELRESKRGEHKW